MKRAVLVAVLVSVVIGGGLARMSGAAILNSAHDLNKIDGVEMPGGQTCIACHTPHNADDTEASAPLWNHTNSTATYTMYNTSPTFEGKETMSSGPTGVSKLCMACHDGTVAVDAFGGMVSDGTKKITGNANLGINLKKSHPVSFDYDADLVSKDSELHDPTKAPISNWVKGGRFECSSCHDVHDNTGFDKMLHASNEGSALCITCHKK